MERWKNCVTLKTRMHGYTVLKVSESCGYGRISEWYELIDTYNPERPVVIGFKRRKNAENWAREHPCYKYDWDKRPSENMKRKWKQAGLWKEDENND